MNASYGRRFQKNQTPKKDIMWGGGLSSKGGGGGSMPLVFHKEINEMTSFDLNEKMQEQFHYVLSTIYPNSHLIDEAIAINQNEKQDKYAQSALEKTIILLFDYAEGKDDILKPSENLIHCALTRAQTKNDLSFDERKRLQMANIVQSLHHHNLGDDKIDDVNLTRHLTIGKKIKENITYLETFFDLQQSYAEKFQNNEAKVTKNKKTKKKLNNKMLDGFNAVIQLAQ